MALHNQHVKQQPQHIRKQTSMEKFKHMFSSQMQHIRSSPKMMFGTIILVIFILVLALLALHYFRVITLPLTFVPQKSVPASHLQYFFF